MQITIVTLLFLLLGTAIALGIPCLTYVYYNRAQRLPFKSMFIGIVVWIFVVEFIEKGFNFIVVTTTTIVHFPLLFSFYAAFLTGICEELIRFMAFKKFLPDNRDWNDGNGSN